jgi:hypothetical protein
MWIAAVWNLGFSGKGRSVLRTGCSLVAKHRKTGRCRETNGSGSFASSLHLQSPTILRTRPLNSMLFTVLWKLSGAI